MSLAAINGHASIHSLPTEMLAIVFQEVVYEATLSNRYLSLFQIAGDLPPQFVLMAVCRDWKSICISFPALWTRIWIIFLPKRSTAIGTPVWDLFALACKNALDWGASLPLDLELDRWYFNEEQVFSTRPDTTFEVFDIMTLSFKILRLAIDHSLLLQVRGDGRRHEQQRMIFRLVEASS
ncbi:hypothetical protein CYLTODRAFT_495301 [Cylindrobasidium torrendii FP15055 ss-10]|uniref:Uncharacterized protein n=1 Tax=Cylindrobasidium torrendii FP15055 ss-10 TaxID=1314674 RepID=A0A0D7AU07_9AGAR|nr:hypothetical protein CYLTODRAFT_495301 [Cylindrobasidium torrendii FP15055 ss-10]